MFNTDAQTLQDLADCLQQAGVASLPPFWSTINQINHGLVYSRLAAALAARGYSAAQVAAWDLGPALERRDTLFRNLQQGGAISGEVSDNLLKGLEVTDDFLRTVQVTAGGAFVAPAGPVGLPAAGALDTGTDVFVWPPQDGSVGTDGGSGDLGDVTRF